MGGFASNVGTTGAPLTGAYQHGALDHRNVSLRYPSPWWDLAGMDLPRNIKTLFSRLAFHATANPLISSAVRKMAAYPVTKVQIDANEEGGFDKHIQRWEDLLHRVLDIQKVQVELAIDYYTYGNAFASVYLPFLKMLRCAGCGETHRLKRLKFKQHWDFKGYQFHLTCPACGHQGKAEAFDKPVRSYKDIRIVRWEPEQIDIDYNPVTTNRRYTYQIPDDVAARIRQKDPWYIADMPQAFLESVRFNRPVRLVDANLFHFSAPSPSTKSARGWGLPPILSAMKDSYHLQILKKAQEAVMLEHLLPLDIFFPASSSPNADPYVHTNLGKWQQDTERQLAFWRRDPNHKPVMPLPLGHQRVGGNGRALMLTQEIRAMSEHVLVGMNVPQEFVFGGLTWSGSSVSIRMLENMFLADRNMQHRFLQHFLIPVISMFMRWAPVKVHMKQFRMADDVQSKQLLMQLKQLGDVSSRTLLTEFEKDYDDEQKLIQLELRRKLDLQKQQMQAQADVQAEIQERAQSSARAAAEPQPQTDTSNRQVNVLHLAQGWAYRLAQMDPTQREQTLAAMAQRMPGMAKHVRALLQSLPTQDAPQQGTLDERLPAPGEGIIPSGGTGGEVVDMRPLPEQRPPRRSAEV